MSRKDMIIVASLINAGLLIVLFASALKSERAGSEMVTNQEPAIESAAVIAAKAETPVVVGDEVDRALQQFVAQQATPSAAAVETPVLAASPASVPSAALDPAASSNPFVEDLKAIATQDPALSAATEPTAPSVQTLVAPIAQAQPLVPEVTEVKVKKGDVLEKIARHHHSTVAEIMKANNLKTTNLRIGQVLKIPHHMGTKAVTTATTVSSQGQAKMYTVKKGDSPWTIAVKNQMKVEDLLKLNNMTEAQAKRLKPGDQLRIQ